MTEPAAGSFFHIPNVPRTALQPRISQRQRPPELRRRLRGPRPLLSGDKADLAMDFPFHLLRGSEPPSHQGSSSSHLASLKSFSPKRGFFIYTDVLQAFLPKARKNGPSARIFIVGVHGRNRTCDLPLRRRSLYPLSYVDSGPIIAPRPFIMKKKEKAGTQGMPAFFRDGRNDGVRTRDLLVPNQAHYQAVLRPVATGAVSNIALSKPLG